MSKILNEYNIKKKEVDFMKKNIKKENKKERKIQHWFKTNVEDAKETSITLFILILFCIIAGIIGFFLFNPAKELKIARDQMISSIEDINKYPQESEERKNQIQKAQSDTELYTKVRDNYLSNDNIIVSKYANIENQYLQFIIMFLIILPYLGVVLLMIKNVKRFTFAVITIGILMPIVIIKNIIGTLVSIIFIKERDDNKKVISNKKAYLPE